MMTRLAAVIAAGATLGQPQNVSAQPVGGLHFGGPVRTSIALGVARLDQSANLTKGPMLLVEPGRGGNRVSAGYMIARGNLGTGASARVSWLHLLRESKGTYAGLELQGLPVFAIGPRVGAFVPLRPAAGRPKLLWIADFSWGL